MYLDKGNASVTLAREKKKKCNAMQTGFYGDKVAGTKLDSIFVWKNAMQVEKLENIFKTKKEVREDERTKCRCQCHIVTAHSQKVVLPM